MAGTEILSLISTILSVLVAGIFIYTLWQRRGKKGGKRGKKTKFSDYE